MSRIACYCRVSTDDQSLQRQVDSTTDYAETHLDADPGEMELYRDKATGTDVDRRAYRNMMGKVETGEIETVVVHSVSRISRSIRDLERTVDRIVEEHGAELHIIGENLQFAPDDDDPYQRAMFRMLGVFAEFEADMIQHRVKEGIAARMENDDYHHGPAPLGFEKDDGEIFEADDFHEVCAKLEMVVKGEMSKRQAAKELDTSRKTINRCIEDRPDLYGLTGVESDEKALEKRLAELEEKVSD